MRLSYADEGHQGSSWERSLTSEHPLANDRSVLTSVYCSGRISLPCNAQPSSPSAPSLPAPSSVRHVEAAELGRLLLPGIGNHQYWDTLIVGHASGRIAAMSIRLAQRNLPRREPVRQLSGFVRCSSCLKHGREVIPSSRTCALSVLSLAKPCQNPGLVGGGGATVPCERRHA